MRLSASYNYFNGEEHFLPSLRALRSEIDHISVVWQEVSNAGLPIASEARRALQIAQTSGLVDEVIPYHPSADLTRKQNETEKRRIGLAAARRADASHFLTLDTDEFYRTQEIRKARQAIIKAGWLSTSVSSYLHLRRPIWRAEDKTNCCFITRILPETVIGPQDFPIGCVDESRRMTATREGHHHFPREDIAMYHMNLVRRDLEWKLRNSSTVDNAFLDQVAHVVEAWVPGAPFEFPNKGALTLTKVTNEFETYDPELQLSKASPNGIPGLNPIRQFLEKMKGMWQ